MGSVGTKEVNYMAACRSIDKDMFSGEVLSVDRVCSFKSVGRSVFISLHKCECAARSTSWWLILLTAAQADHYP